MRPWWLNLIIYPGTQKLDGKSNAETATIEERHRKREESILAAYVVRVSMLPPMWDGQLVEGVASC